MQNEATIADTLLRRWQYCLPDMVIRTLRETFSMDNEAISIMFRAQSHVIVHMIHRNIKTFDFWCNLFYEFWSNADKLALWILRTLDINVSDKTNQFHSVRLSLAQVRSRMTNLTYQLQAAHSDRNTRVGAEATDDRDDSLNVQPAKKRARPWTDETADDLLKPSKRNPSFEHFVKLRNDYLESRNHKLVNHIEQAKPETAEYDQMNSTVRCSKCKSDQIVIKFKQLRGLDEGQAVLYECESCHHGSKSQI
jgi:DNA-directed RNA polymerase subunit M/transcription elongation factor TFIIS